MIDTAPHPLSRRRRAVGLAVALALLVAATPAAAGGRPNQHGRLLGAVRAAGGHVGAAQSAGALTPQAACVDASTPVCLTDDQLTAELDRVITAQSLPRGLGDVYFILTPQDVGSCFDGGHCAYSYYCAYHSSFVSGGVPTIYAVDPYATTPECKSYENPNGDAADDTINPLSHEHNEAVTDPLGNAWWDDVTGEENGDKCAWLFGPSPGIAGQKHNQTINGNSYYLQSEWSNDRGGCVLDGTVSAPVLPDGTPGALSYHGGPVMHTNRTHVLFWAPTGHPIPDSYRLLVEQYLTDVAADSGTTGNVYGTNPQYTDGTGSADYSSTYAGAIVDTAPYPPWFSFFAPAGPHAGDVVSFAAALTGDATGATTTYSWDLGDGAHATGLHPAHAYSAPGIYNVALTVSDGANGSASTTRQLVVAPGDGTASTPGAPAPSGTVAPPAPTRLSVPAQVARVSASRIASIRLACPGGQRCLGTVTLSGRVAAARHGMRTALLGLAHFAIGSGRTATVRVPLTQRASLLLRRHRRLTVTLRATATGAAAVARAIALTR